MFITASSKVQHLYSFNIGHTPRATVYIHDYASLAIHECMYIIMAISSYGFSFGTYNSDAQNKYARKCVNVQYCASCKERFTVICDMEIFSRDTDVKY